MAIGLAFVVASVMLTSCSSEQSSLATLAADTFSSEDTWRGDERYISVTITETNFEAILELETFLDELGFTPAVYERMNRTRALDGTQSATSEMVNVTWTYHPDNGLQAVFELEARS